jgi:hypothetical protein
MQACRWIDNCQELQASPAILSEEGSVSNFKQLHISDIYKDAIFACMENVLEVHFYCT